MAQTDEVLIDSLKKEGLLYRIQTDVKLGGLTIFETYKRPFHWQKKEWIQFGAVLGISVLATTLDEPTWKYMQDHQSSAMDNFASVGDFLGQPENNYPIMLAVWGGGVVFNNEWMRDTGLMLFASVTTSGILQTLSKTIVGRARPSTDVGHLTFDPFGGPAYHSFPSGHTMLAVAMNWVLAKQINWLPAKILFYSLPAVVGISRIYEGAHWLSDILLGSALGIACAEAVVNIYPRLKDKQQGFTFSPTSSGMGLVYKF